MEINIILHLRIGFLGASDSKECRRPQVQSLSWEDPLKKDVATHSSILAWEIPWTEEPGGLPSMGSESDTLISVHKRHLSLFLSTYLSVYLLVPLSVCLPPFLMPFQSTGGNKAAMAGNTLMFFT